jgi:hypothetical protein
MAHKLLRVSTPDGGLNRAYITSAQFVPGGSFNAYTPELRGHWEQNGIPVYSDATMNRVFFEGTANSNYHSLQAQLRGRIGRSLQVVSSFTYSHAIDDASDFFDTFGSPALPQNSFRRDERGSASYDIRTRVVSHFVWDVSRGRAGRWLARWQLSGIHTLQSGQPFTVNTIYDWNGDGNLTDRLDNTVGLIDNPSGASRPVRLALAPGVSTFQMLATTRDQTGSLVFRDGRLGRNAFRGFSLHNLDLALSKHLPWRERNLEFRAEAFNVFNSPHFGLPERWLESPAFGAATTTVSPARTLQVALKFAF